MVVRENPEDPWKAIGETTVVTDDVDIHSHENSVPDQVTAGQKRARSSSAADEPQTKRVREGEAESNGTNGVHTSQCSPCLAPPSNSFAQKIYAQSDSSGTSSLGTGDIFLTEGWRDRWCRCPSCLPSLEAHPYLFKEEETYEPPEDPDSGLSLEELGLRALQRLPRDRAIDGIRAFNAMRDELMNHLRPFAQEQKEVTEADIRAFFDVKMAPKDT
ncbi:hypothetical protein NLI96_g11158 [Meripilus lineatus]|uniref:Uncharacterized protein n=1 Tax=Meripilus lineatus TaxID=2056292 RepID=A0AAD5UTU7_9APHY|nr:hypothetical protein NLI96_g11158 [Physisporinus lineatus]